MLSFPPSSPLPLQFDLLRSYSLRVSWRRWPYPTACTGSVPRVGCRRTKFLSKSSGTRVPTLAQLGNPRHFPRDRELRERVDQSLGDGVPLDPGMKSRSAIKVGRRPSPVLAILLPMAMSAGHVTTLSGNYPTCCPGWREVYLCSALTIDVSSDGAVGWQGSITICIVRCSTYPG
jgi:hypothetical protein